MFISRISVGFYFHSLTHPCIAPTTSRKEKKNAFSSFLCAMNYIFPEKLLKFSCKTR